MRILHLLSSNKLSGAENVVCQIMSLFKDEPFIEMLYCSEDGQIRNELKNRDLPFVSLKKMNTFELKKIIDVVHPDVIHAHDRLASYTASKVSQGIPIVAHMHVNNNKGVKLFLKNLLWTFSSKKFSHIFWVSKSSFDGFQFKRFLEKKSSILRNTMDKNMVLNKSKLDDNQYNYDAVYCGRLSYQKNPNKLMKICAKLVLKKPNIKIGIIGDGEYLSFVKEYIIDNKLSCNVYCLGFMPNPLKVIGDSKVLIMTSRFEGTPMVALEAQILGVPIVSTPVDGMKDIVKNGENGYLETDDALFVERVINLIDNQATRDEMSLASIEYIKEFTDTLSYKKDLQDTYKRILGD